MCTHISFHSPGGLSPWIFPHIPWGGKYYSAPMLSPTAHIFYNFLSFAVVSSYPSHSHPPSLSSFSSLSLSLSLKSFIAHLLSCKQSLTKDQTLLHVLAAQLDSQPPPFLQSLQAPALPTPGPLHLRMPSP